MKPVYESMNDNLNNLDGQLTSMSSQIEEAEPYYISNDVLSLNENSTEGEVRNAFGGGTFAVNWFLQALRSKRPIIMRSSSGGRKYQIVSVELDTISDYTMVRFVVIINGESSETWGVVIVTARTPANSDMMLQNFNVVYLWQNMS